MKKLTTLGSLLLIFGMTACQKAETPAPATSSEAPMRRGNGGTTATIVYGGQATGLNATLWNVQNGIFTSTQTLFAQTAMLPSIGGTQSASSTQPAIPGVVTAESMTSSVTGQAGSTVADAVVNSVTITTGSLVITADRLQATSTASCGSTVSGNSQLTNLVINGSPVTITGAPNQAIPLPYGGLIIINEQSTSKKGGVNLITTTAIHVLIPNVSDIRLASAKAEIKC